MKPLIFEERCSQESRISLNSLEPSPLTEFLQGNYDEKAERQSAIDQVQILLGGCKELILEHLSISPVGYIILGHVLKVAHAITRLSLAYSQIGVAGAIALAEPLKENKSLTQLDVLHNNIGDEGAKALAQVLVSKSSITYFNFAYNKIGPEGAKALAKAFKGNNSITQLDFAANRIGDRGVKALAEAIKENKSFTQLDVSYNNIGGEGVIALVKALEKNRSIRQLHFAGNQFDNKGIVALTTFLKQHPLFFAINKCGILTRLPPKVLVTNRSNGLAAEKQEKVSLSQPVSDEQLSTNNSSRAPTFLSTINALNKEQEGYCAAGASNSPSKSLKS